MAPRALRLRPVARPYFWSLGVQNGLPRNLAFWNLAARFRGHWKANDGGGGGGGARCICIIPSCGPVGLAERTFFSLFPGVPATERVSLTRRDRHTRREGAPAEGLYSIQLLPRNDSISSFLATTRWKDLSSMHRVTVALRDVLRSYGTWVTSGLARDWSTTHPTTAYVPLSPNGGHVIVK